MLEVEVIEGSAAAALALDPIKSRILEHLAAPESAASLAGRIGLPRQKINYHLRALEQHGLVEAVEQRQWGGLIERRMVASAASYVVSPAALGAIGADPARTRDRLSASYLIAVAARTLREVGALWRKARQTEKRLATLSLDVTIAFRSPGERAAFTRELTSAIATLAARYHDEHCEDARPHRLVIASYPAPDEPRLKEHRDADQEG
jgi:DNA-binding transcriptional ArsR family regulator